MTKFCAAAIIGFRLFVSAEIVQAQSWVKPGELRNKALIDAGLYTQWSIPAVNSRSLAEHPGFTTTHPFDGIVVRLLLDAKWCEEQGFDPNPDDPPQNQQPYLDSLVWSTHTVPYGAVESAIEDLKRVQWGTLTDNFVWYQFRDGGGSPVDLTKQNDWASVQGNAVLTARVCREAELKGIFFDTEQYGYAPMKLGTPGLRRQRGQQWIEAVQSEFPEIRVLFTFAWCEDLDNTAFLVGMKDFLNGVLDGVRAPAQLINAYENTFYYGQSPGSRFTKKGFAGNRTQFASARSSIKSWKRLSGAADKYDHFVRIGMAAWLESDPWDLTPDWLSGHNHTIWSNVPMALAHSDRYVWCWSEHTGYLAAQLNHEAVRGAGPNPFLASMTNQTFNTDRERVTSLAEDFSTDPLQRGWYFDFDILEVGRRFDPQLSVPIFFRESVPYFWSCRERAVRIQGVWLTGEKGDTIAGFGKQRRRYVHPICIAGSTTNFQAALDFSIKSFGPSPGNPMVLGLFHSSCPVDRQSFTLRISSVKDSILSLSDDNAVWQSKSTSRLQVDRTYRMLLNYNASKRRLLATVSDVEHGLQICQLDGDIPENVAAFQFDEIGVALSDLGASVPPSATGYTYRLEQVRLKISRE